MTPSKNMEKAKKLKDLRKGDRVYMQGFVDTTPIVVVKAKRTGDLMTVELKWDDHTYIGYGHAHDKYMCIYSKEWKSNAVISTDYNEEKRVQNRREKDRNEAEIGACVISLIKAIKRFL